MEIIKIIGIAVAAFLTSCGNGMDVNKNTSSLDYQKVNNIVKDTTIYGDLYNKFDSNGKRTGLWKECDGPFFREKCYRNGKLEGIYKEYFMSTGRLSSIAKIAPSVKDSFFFIFNDSSHILLYYNDFDYNSQPIIGEYDRYVPEYRCYCWQYLPSGNLFSCDVIGFDDTCLEYAEDFGERIYFKDDGTVVGKPVDDRFISLNVRILNAMKKDVNKSDSTGLRQGLWVEDEGYVEAYYKDGALNGLYRKYSKKTGTLESFGEYCHGEKIGAWFYFDDYGRLSGQRTYEGNGKFNLVGFTGGDS